MSDLLFYALKDLLERSKTDEEARFDFHATRLKHKVTIKQFVDEAVKRGIAK